MLFVCDHISYVMLVGLMYKAVCPHHFHHKELIIIVNINMTMFRSEPPTIFRSFNGRKFPPDTLSFDYYYFFTMTKKASINFFIHELEKSHNV